MSNSKDMVENLEAQISELEALQSVYPDELVVSDHGILADINNYTSGTYKEMPGRLEYSISVSVPKGTVELHVNLPPEYPNAVPEIYARSSLLDRAQQADLNRSLSTFTASQEKGEPCVYALISWLQDNFEEYKTYCEINEKVKRSPEKAERKNSTNFSRYWIYSHHIYSKIKRREISDLAKENGITGFSLAGKPGIICIEGATDDCEDWWQRIKGMCWQKILVKLKEEEPNVKEGNFEGLRKFSGFEEISFPSSDRHNDMGQLYKYLMEHDSQHVFKEYFGLEGKAGH